MNPILLQLKTNKKYLLLGICLLLLIFFILLAIKLIFFHSPPTNTKKTITDNTKPSVTAVPPFKQNPTLDKDIPPDAQPSTKALTPTEETYAKAKQQVFSQTSQTGTGTLVVASGISGVTIRISQPNEPETGTGNFVPSNTTPFIYTDMPSGYYLVDARKDGYDESQVTVRVEPGKITRLTVSLQPFSSY